VGGRGIPARRITGTCDPPAPAGSYLAREVALVLSRCGAGQPLGQLGLTVARQGERVMPLSAQ
jgi:hypothetical protein